MAVASEDPRLGVGPDPDLSECSLAGDGDDGSILSEDSVLPAYEREEQTGGPITTLYQACSRNAPASLKRILERGVTKEEVMELDINGRNGLMTAVAKGFIDIVSTLHTCPFIDINHQDNEGQTALMMAAQSGFVTILNYLLNYYPGVEVELMDTRGFTALLKASIAGHNDCVSTLVMAGADVNGVDGHHLKDARDWALKTGHWETFQRIRRLVAKPRADQFCDSYVPEWPDLKELVAKATAHRNVGQRMAHKIRQTFTFTFPQDPQDGGVLDSMVRMTSSVHSPLVATGCHPLCPTSPPEVGKRRMAVPELSQAHSGKELEGRTRHGADRASMSSDSSGSSAASTSSVSLSCANGVKGFIPRNVARRNSVFPAGCIPQIRVTKSSEPTPKKEKKKKRSKSKTHLEPPIWKYKEAKEEKKKEKKRLEKENKEKEKEKEKQKKKK